MAARRPSSLLPVLLVLAVAAPAFTMPSQKLSRERRSDEKCEMGVNCRLPDCLCPSVTHPGELEKKDVPQFVVLSFDDAVTTSNKDFYLRFKDMLNPNHCRITMTFFLSHLYTNYTIANELHRLGHEIALHSVTHKSDVSGYWRPANESVWLQEMEDLRKMIVHHAKIPEKDIKGWRAPFLEVGGDEMFSAIEKMGLEYDSSWPTLRYTNWYGDKPKGALWPYTLDFVSTQDCQLGECPTETYPGKWVMPMVDLNDNQNQPCAMLDTCRSETDELLGNADAVERFLMRNFEINYYNNKAPFGLYVHHSWFYESVLNGSVARQEGYTRFLNFLGTMEDVFVVSLDRVLAWMKNPVPYSEINSIDELSCPAFDPVTNCPSINNYKFGEELNIPLDLTEVYMGSCTKPQPPYFPWLYNPMGLEDMPIVD